MAGVLLLANPESKAWEFATKVHEHIISKYYWNTNLNEFPLEPLEIKYFRNKEFKPHVPKSIRRKEVYFIHDSSLDPSYWWVQLLLIKDMLLSASAERLSFVLPNLLWSRQDRKDQPHVPISARAVAESISQNLRNHSRIITMDLHAAQVQGFYNESIPLDNLHSFPVMASYFIENHPQDLENLVVVSPDAGGVTRARAFLHQLIQKTSDKYSSENYSLAIINKLRLGTGEIEVLKLAGEVEGKTALLIDDIIDSGYTLCEASDLLKEKGAKKVIGYGTHGLFTEGYDHIFKSLDSVITSNTMPINDSRVEVIPVDNLFAEAIYRDYKGLSISELF